MWSTDTLWNFTTEARRAVAQTSGVGAGITANEPLPEKAKWLLYVAIGFLLIAFLLLIHYYNKNS